MKGQKGEEKLVFYAGGGKDLKKYRKLLLIGSGIFGGIFLFNDIYGWEGEKVASKNGGWAGGAFWPEKLDRNGEIWYS